MSAPLDAQRTKRPRAGTRRAPFASRRHLAREVARARVVSRVTRGLTAEQRSHDPLPPVTPAGSSLKRFGREAAVLAVAILFHAAVVGLGFLVAALRPETGKREIIRQEIRVVVQEPEVEPPPPPVEKPPEPLQQPAPKMVKTPRPPEPAPQPKAAETAEPPPRVVGLSLESTVEGGDGPAFAVGNTLQGETAERAAAPKTVVPGATGPIAESPRTLNQATARIPMQGVAITPPKRVRAKKPAYPEMLKAQGIEADVPLVVRIDESGKVTEVKIVEPSPYREFDEAARAAALAEEWEPARRNGVAIAYTLNFVSRFRIEVEGQ